MSMTNAPDRVEIITSVQRRRRWTASEKVRMVEETFEPGRPVIRCPVLLFDSLRFPTCGPFP